MKTLAVISILASAAFAQSTSSTSTTSALIPSGISDGCLSMLETIDSDPTLAGCTSSIIPLTQAYTTGSASSAGVSSTLANLCSAASTCSQTALRTTLANFYQSCTAELTSSPNQEVINLYNVIYVLSPLNTAICSKDDNGQFCATEIPAASSPSLLTPSEVQGYLGTVSGSETVLNATAYQASGVLYLFIDPSLAAAQLCVTCTRDVLTSYINWETNTPYALGVSSTSFLSGQLALYNAVQSKCGSNFLSGAVQAAGGIGTNSAFSSSGAQTVEVGSRVVVLLGAVALGMAVLL